MYDIPSVKSKLGLLKLLPLYMVILLDVMGILLVFPVLTPLILQVHGGILPPETPLLWRDFLYGFAIALFPLFMFFSTPTMGDLSDKFGRKKILLICLIGTTVSYLISAVGVCYSSLSLLLIGRAVAGLAAGTQPIATAAIIDVSTEKTKIRNLGWVVLANSVGLIIGPLVSGLTGDIGFSVPFILAAVLSLLNAIFLFYTMQEIVPERTHKKIYFSKGFTLFLSAFSNKRFRLLSLIGFCYVLGWSLYFQAIGWLFMEKFHYDVQKIGLFLGFIGVIFIFATSVVTRLVLNFFSHETVAYLFFVFLMAISLIGCALTQSELSQWIWVIFAATGNVICYTVYLSIFSSLAGKDSQGWIMGATSAIMAITWTVGGFISGPLGYIDIHVPFWTGASLCFMSFLLMLTYRKKHHATI